jgi:MoxR-like ATPase
MDELDQKIDFSRNILLSAAEEVSKRIVGQKQAIIRLITGVLTDGHILLEGLPGLAKTTMVKTLGEILGLEVKRVQFTPDLLPADIIGTEIFVPTNSEFKLKKGPIFTQILIADEINRAPAKVQSALLEAMQERSVTIGDSTFKLEQPFLVLATQNPIEQEGTYNLPEAQVDRFLFKLKIGYGSLQDEIELMARSGEQINIQKLLNLDTILDIKNTLGQIQVSEALRHYIASLVVATRNPSGKLSKMIDMGASPRASLAFEKVVRVNALLDGRTFAIPQDVKDVALDILRHRIRLSYEGESHGLSTDEFILELLKTVEVP